MNTFRLSTLTCLSTLLLTGIVLSGCNSFGQKQKSEESVTTDTSQSTGNKDRRSGSKLDQNKVPKAVSDVYLSEYPSATYSNWYGYPSYDGNYWYESDPFLYTSQYPENYVVEYTQDSVPYTAMYNKSGKKIATHKAYTSDLPKAVTAYIDSSQYKTWIVGKDKEEIFRDKDNDQLKVYKVNFQKGEEKHTLYIQQDGHLLKDNKIS